MEDQNGAPSDGVAAAPFSELISAWLDEGDRLDEKALATTASAPPVVETRARRILTLLRPALDRYRVVVLAGAGLIPFALFALTHRSAAAPIPVAAAATVVRVTTPSRSPEPAPPPAEAPLPPSPLPGPEIAGICERAEAPPALLDGRSPVPPPAPRPHHHHHHALKQPAPSGMQVPRAVAHAASPGAPTGPSAVARPAPPSTHPGLAAAPPRSAPASRKGQPLR